MFRLILRVWDTDTLEIGKVYLINIKNEKGNNFKVLFFLQVSWIVVIE